MLLLICLCALLSTGTSINMERQAVSFPPEATAVIKAANQKCSEEIEVPANIIDLVREGNYIENDAFQKYAYCVFQETGFANTDGHIKVSQAAELFPKEINILPVLENCDKQGKDPVETTYLSFKCFQDTSPVRLAL